MVARSRGPWRLDRRPDRATSKSSCRWPASDQRGSGSWPSSSRFPGAVAVTVRGRWHSRPGSLRLSPNLLAHGALATMELPLVAGTTAMFWLFWRFLETNRQFWFWAAAAVGGLAFSCKFTTILIPPILGAVWWVVRWQKGERTVDGTHTACRTSDDRFPADHAARGRCRDGICTPAAEHLAWSIIPRSRNGLAPLRGDLARPSVRDSAPPGLGRLRNSDAPSSIRRSELSLRRAADEGVVVLLSGCSGGQGSPHVLAPGSPTTSAPKAWRAHIYRPKSTTRCSRWSFFSTWVSRRSAHRATTVFVTFFRWHQLAIVWISALGEQCLTSVAAGRGSDIRCAVTVGLAGYVDCDCRDPSLMS